jgi:hypothetical protein
VTAHGFVRLEGDPSSLRVAFRRTCHLFKRFPELRVNLRHSLSRV